MAQAVKKIFHNLNTRSESLQALFRPSRQSGTPLEEGQWPYSDRGEREWQTSFTQLQLDRRGQRQWKRSFTPTTQQFPLRVQQNKNASENRTFFHEEDEPHDISYRTQQRSLQTQKPQEPSGEDFAPAILQFCGETSKAVQKAKDCVTNLIMDQQASKSGPTVLHKRM